MEIFIGYILCLSVYVIFCMVDNKLGITKTEKTSTFIIGFILAPITIILFIGCFIKNLIYKMRFNYDKKMTAKYGINIDRPLNRAERETFEKNIL